jgi:flagellar hook-associated protein 3 FlgL
MRITSKALFNQFTRGLKDNLAELYDLSNRLATGKKIAKPSEDVLAATMAMDYKLSISQNDQYDRNITHAENYLNFNNTVLTQVSYVIRELKKLTLNGSDDSISAEEWSSYAEQAANLRDYLLDLSNSKYGDQYVFAGSQSDQKAYVYDAINQVYAYQGDSGQLKLPVGKETNQTINFAGSSADSSMFTVFSYAPQALETIHLPDGSLVTYTSVPDPVLGVTTVTVDITHPDHPGDPNYEDSFSFSNFMDMANISTHAWQYQNMDGTALSESKSLRRIQALSTPMDKADKQVLTVQTSLGSRQVNLSDQKNRLNSGTQSLQNALTQIEDADMTEMAMDLQKVANTLEALRLSSSKILSKSLFDFLT